MKKKAITIKEQLQKLEARGIIIKDKEKASENLLDIGYYRLGFYCFPFEKSYPNKKNRNHEYVEGTTFEDIVKLYYFDVDLRNILMKYLYRIEINFRTQLIYTISNKFSNDPYWFVNEKIMKKYFIRKFDIKVYNESFKLQEIIKTHHENHPEDRYAPAWKTIEFMTLGNIIQLYTNINNKNKNIKKEIASKYNIRKISIFENFLKTLKQVRNTCAHSGILVDIRIKEAIINGPFKVTDNDKNNLYGTILMINHLLKSISHNRAKEMIDDIKTLLNSQKQNPTLFNIIKKCSSIDKL